MKRAVVALVGVLAGVSAAGARAAGPVRAYLSAPGHAAPGGRLWIDGLLLNAGRADAIVSYRLEAEGLKVAGKRRGGRAWIAAGAFLPVSWKAAITGKTAVFRLYVNGRKAAERTFRVGAGARPPLVAKRFPVTAKPRVWVAPEAGRKYAVELVFTAGAAGERAWVIEELSRWSGFETNALVARCLVPAALGDGKPGPEWALLRALQQTSGGWGAKPLSLADVRTSSWVVFWLGHLARAGGPVAPKVRDAAFGYLRRALAGTAPEMRARVLAALAAHGAIRKEDLDHSPRADGSALSPMAQLLAATAGAGGTLPPEDSWGRLGVGELAVLACCLVDRKTAFDAGALFRRLVERWGTALCFRTHAAPLYALAMHKLAGRVRGGGTVAVAVDGLPAKEWTVGPKRPLVRCLLVAAPGPGGKATLTVSAEKASGVSCRLIVRRAE